jgi:uncharacterized Zn-binding protein involved in type VI secretion
MKGLLRINDLTDGPANIPISPGGSTVLVGGLPVAVQGSYTAPHYHGNSLVIGVFNQEFSSTITAEGKPVLLVGSACSCGHKAITGSVNVRGT